MSAITRRIRSILRRVDPARQSVRVRLAIWHTATLGLVLVAFFAFGYVYLERTTREHGDKILGDMLAAFEISWAAEREELPDSTQVVTAADAMQDARYRDRRLLLFTDAGHLILASDSTPLTPASAVERMRVAKQSPLAATFATADSGYASFATFGADDSHVRAALRRLVVSGQPFIVVALRDLSADAEVTETFLNWVMAAIPFALAVSALGGYLIARRTLRPVVEMARASEQIGAGSLDARLAIANPHDELGQLGGVLNRLLGRLEVSFDQQRQFMADASHELRSPVAVLYAAAEIALTPEARPADELRQALTIVRGEGRRLTRIVEDLFLLARADTGQQPLRREKMYLEELLHDVAAAARALGKPRGINVVWQPSEESPFVGDALMLTRVVMNLVDNAIRHSPDGGEVRIALSSEAGELRVPHYLIAVSDNGTGIPGEMQSRVFERFVRADTARTRNVSAGAGLGLSIARWIAEEHGGRLLLRSSSAAGSSFVLELPAEPGAESLRG